MMLSTTIGMPRPRDGIARIGQKFHESESAVMARIVKTVPVAVIIVPAMMHPISAAIESPMVTFGVSFSESVSETVGVLGSAALMH